MQDIAEVIRPGWRFLKGERRWGPLYRQAVAEVTDPHLSDEAVRQLAEGFVCDYVWTQRKMARGEFLTAQRMLHRELAEVNFQLLHELKTRQGERTFTKARRIERITRSPDELASVTVDARGWNRRPSRRQSTGARPRAESLMARLLGEERAGAGRFSGCRPGGAAAEAGLVNNSAITSSSGTSSIVMSATGPVPRISCETAAMSVAGTRRRNFPSSPRTVLP